MARNLKFEVFYDKPVERVWAALTNARALAAWLMPNDFAPKLGHRFKFRTKPAPGFDGIVDCEVLEIDPLKRLVYSWTGGGVETKVIWTLKAVEGGTQVTLEHSGFRGVRGLLVSSILSKGWNSRILRVRLPLVLSRWNGRDEFPQDLIAECHR